MIASEEELNDAIINAYMKFAAAIIKSGSFDQRFLESEWCEELKNGVAEYAAHKLKAQDLQGVARARNPSAKEDKN